MSDITINKIPYRQYIVIMAIPMFFLTLFYTQYQYRLYYTFFYKCLIHIFLFLIYIPSSTYFFLKGGKRTNLSFYVIFLLSIFLFFLCVNGAMISMEKKEEIVKNYYEKNVESKVGDFLKRM